MIKQDDRRPTTDDRRSIFYRFSVIGYRFVFLYLLISLLLLNSCTSPVSIIPPERLPDWNPGVEGGIPAVDVVVELSADDLRVTKKAARIIQQAIDDVEGQGVVLLPSGTYTLTDNLVLKSGVVLRGQGIDQTRLIFDLPDLTYTGAIAISGSYDKGREVPIISGSEAGSTKVTVENAESLREGQTIIIFSENDADVMYTSDDWNVAWAQQAVGQMLRVKQISGNTLTLDVPLRLTHKAELQPRVQIVRPIEQAGVEDLYVKRLDEAEDMIIYIQNAVNVWVRNIESDYCTRAHVWIIRGRFVTVEGSTFHHAWNYGGGGHGYGVVAGRHATDNLVTNNIFYHLRHSMMVKEGANGNVFSYNYSFDNVKYTDVSIHGHYSYMNLFEGNDVVSITYADYWGPTGPFTTAYRNRVQQNIALQDASHDANVVGNTTANISSSPTCERAFIENNNVRYALPSQDTITDTVLAPSLYLDMKPDFWGDHPWPGIGADVDAEGDPLPLPAEVRYQNSQK